MKKKTYDKPAFKLVNIEVSNLCAGSQCGGIDVKIIRDVKESRKTFYRFDKNETINKDMWNPKF